jgi:predicted PurR-regulated permease PerM
VPAWLDTAAAYSWRLALLAGVVAGVGYVFLDLSVITVPAAAAVLLAAGLVPLVDWLESHNCRRRLGAVMVMFALLAILYLAIEFIVPSFSSEFAQLGSQVKVGIREAQDWLIHGPLHLSHRQVSSVVSELEKSALSDQTKLVHGAISGVTTVAKVAVGAVICLVLTFFLLVRGGDAFRSAVSLLRPDRRSPVIELGRAIVRTLSGYVRGTALNGLVNALVLGAALIVLGVPLVVPICVITFLGGFLPLAGAIVSGFLAAVVALVAQGPVAALVVVVVTIAIHNLEGYLVGPLVLGRAVKLHPAVILVVLAVGTEVGGLVGAFLAIPATVVLMEVAGYVRRQQSGQVPEDVIPPDDRATTTARPRRSRPA